MTIIARKKSDAESYGHIRIFKPTFRRFKQVLYDEQARLGYKLSDSAMLDMLVEHYETHRTSEV